MGSFTTHGLPYPVGTDRVMDGDNAIQALAEAIDTALLGDTGNLTAAAAGFTVKSGFTTLNGTVRKRGNLVQVSFSFVTTAALGAGNIANIACLGIPAGYVPVVRQALGPESSGPGVFYIAETNGSIYVVSTPAAVTAGDTIGCAGVWMV